jgi:NAD(P)-dependent dehydrogenase (short-subunit alcohol dehydrogenase family)
LATDSANTIIGLVRNKAAADKTVAADGLENVTMVEADIANHESLLKAREQVAHMTGGSIDFLINNAALVDARTELQALDEIEPELLTASLEDSFKVNVVGVVHTINAFLPLIKKGKDKKVVLISSGMADPALVNSGVTGSAPYAISKAAANLAIFKYNAKYKNEGLLFFAISPGIVATWEGEEEPEGIQGFRRMVPSWSGPLTPLESAKACVKVIHDFTAEKDGGSFVSHYGNQQWL